MIDLKINLGHIVVSVTVCLLTLCIKWAVGVLQRDRKIILAALQRMDYVDTISTATYKVVTVKYPNETGAAVQEILRSKAETQQHRGSSA
jgi:hypothetical protein